MTNTAQIQEELFEFLKTKEINDVFEHITEQILM